MLYLQKRKNISLYGILIKFQQGSDAMRRIVKQGVLPVDSNSGYAAHLLSAKSHSITSYEKQQHAGTS